MPENRSDHPRSAWKWPILVSVLLIAACTTGEEMSDIHDGMTKDQVVNTLGQPDGYSRQGSTETLKYADRLVSGWGWDRADYQVSLSGGHVFAYGPGPVLNPASAQ
jgi:hypothetical protein